MDIWVNIDDEENFIGDRDTPIGLGVVIRKIGFIKGKSVRN